MKRFLLIIGLVALMALSCTEAGIGDGAVNGNRIKLSVTTLEVDFEGDEEYKVIVDSPCSWEAESKNEWLHIVTKQGIAGKKELWFYADCNYDSIKREGTIIVTNRDYGYINELYVIQKEFEPRMSCTSSLTFDSEGGSLYAYVTANVSYNYHDNANWLSCSRTDEGLKVTAEKYTSTDERNAEIVLYNEDYDVEKIINVKQMAFEPNLYTDKSELIFGAEYSSQTVNVTTNAQFSISESSNWLECSKGESSVTITVSASDVTEERSADVKIYLPNYNVSQTIKVTQKKFSPSISIGQAELLFDSEGGTKTISVAANFDYNISENADWLSCQITTSGVKVYASTYDDTINRTAEIIIMNDKYSIREIVNVTQQAFVPILDIECSELVFESDGGSKNISIVTNVKDFDVLVSEDWITCSKNYNGLLVTIQPSEITEERSGQIIVTLPQYMIEQKIHITQKEFTPYLSISQSALSFTADGGMQSIDITTNIEYNIDVSIDWLSYGKDEDKITFVASQNLKSKTTKRSADIVIYNERYNKYLTIKIEQQPYKIGDLLAKNGAMGIIYYIDSSIIKLVSVEESSLVTWEGAKTWCKNYGNWMLPTINELQTIYNRKSVLNSSLTAYGHQTFGNGCYWSSEGAGYFQGSYFVYLVDFEDGEYFNGSEQMYSVYTMVRAVTTVY